MLRLWNYSLPAFAAKMIDNASRLKCGAPCTHVIPLAKRISDVSSPDKARSTSTPKAADALHTFRRQPLPLLYRAASAIRNPARREGTALPQAAGRIPGAAVAAAGRQPRIRFSQ